MSKIQLKFMHYVPVEGKKDVSLNKITSNHGDNGMLVTWDYLKSELCDDGMSVTIQNASFQNFQVCDGGMPVTE